jgi:DNA-3-methyladenine glycosylase II
MSNHLIRIPAGNDFSFRECHWFLHRNLDDCLHEIAGDAIIKALRVKGQTLLCKISAEPGAVTAEILQGSNSEETKQAVVDFIGEWFDLGRDLTPFYRLLRQHHRLRYMPADFNGLRLVGIPDLFEALCWCITGQQINLRFAYTLKRRLVEQYGEQLHYQGKTYYLFPQPAALAAADTAVLRSMQFSARKAGYLTGLAHDFVHGTISKEQLVQLPDDAARQQVLLSLKGIGIWTANYALMKSLRAPSSVPYGDAGLLNALVQHQLIEDKNDHTGIHHFFSRFPGWESYMSFYLWRSLAVQ